MRLSERLLQELDGMAAATGLEPAELLRLDVLRDALRMKGLSARLPGALGVARGSQSYEARAWWAGADASLLEEQAIVIWRKPRDGHESVVVSWPGSLGALAALTSSGLGFLAADAEVHDKRRLGFGGGRPFCVGAREALATSTSAAELMGRVTGTMGHVFVAFSLERGAPEPLLQALAAFEAYGESSPPALLGTADLIGLGPLEDGQPGRAAALADQLSDPRIDLPARWRTLKAAADPSGAPPRGPRVTLRWSAEGGELIFVAHEGGSARVVRLPPWKGRPRAP